MKKRVCSTILLSMAVISFNCSTAKAFEMPKVQIPSNPVSNFTGGGNSEISGQIGTINASIAVAEGYMNNSIFALSSVLLDKDTLQKLSLEKQEILNKTKGKEKEKQAAINKIATDYASAIQTAKENGTINTTIAQLNADKKKLYSDAVFNVGLAGLNYTDASLKVASLVQSISANPAAATSLAFQLKDLKKLATSLPEQAKNATSLSSNLVKVGMAGKISVKLPTSKTEQPKPLKDNFLDEIK